MCPSNGDCELQDVAGKIGVREVRYGLNGKHHLGQDKDRSNPYFTFNPSKCIVCSRCVRACQEIQGQFAISLTGRGFDSKNLCRSGTVVYGIRLCFLRSLRQSLPNQCPD